MTDPVPIENLIRREVARAARRKVTPGETPKCKPAAVAGWRDSLIVNQEGAPKSILANAITALRLAPEWAGVLAFNEFSLGTVALQPAPWDGSRPRREWSDHEDRLTANWLQHHGIFVSVEVAGQAVQSVAKDRCFHPVREYLDSLDVGPDAAYRHLVEPVLGGGGVRLHRGRGRPLAGVGRGAHLSAGRESRLLPHS